MARNQGKKSALWAISGVALVLLVLAVGTMLNRENQDSPGPTPDRAYDNRTTTPQPARLSDIQDALLATDRAIAEGSWEKARDTAQHAKEQWLSYRTPMQASAGRRMWSTGMSQDFQTKLNGLLVDIAEQQPQPARAKIRGMLETIDMYDDQVEGRLETPPVHD